MHWCGTLCQPAVLPPITNAGATSDMLLQVRWLRCTYHITGTPVWRRAKGSIMQQALQASLDLLADSDRMSLLLAWAMQLAGVLQFDLTSGRFGCVRLCLRPELKCGGRVWG